MPAGSHVAVDTSVLDRILRNLDGNTADNVRAVAFNVEGKTKVQIRVMNAIDTGALVNSVYTKTYSGAWQDGQRSSEAKIAADIHAKRPVAEVVELPRPANDREAYVGPSVGYGVHVHYGAHNRAGRPFLAEAVRAAERELEAAARRIVTDGR